MELVPAVPFALTGISVIVPPLKLLTNRFPAELKARLYGLFKPDAKVDAVPPGVISVM